MAHFGVFLAGWWFLFTTVLSARAPFLFLSQQTLTQLLLLLVSVWVLSSMDGMGNTTIGPNTPLLILAFLNQTDCGDAEYRKELLSLSRELQVSLDINSNGFCIETQEDGTLESDGHLPSYIRGSFDDIHPTVELEGPGQFSQCNCT